MSSQPEALDSNLSEPPAPEPSVLEAVRVIGPSIAARSCEIEEARRMPLDLVDVIRDTQAFAMFVPAELGGPDLPAWDGLAVMEELAYHDGAAGWSAMIASTTSLMSCLLPEPFATEIFADPNTISGGFAMPAGRAVAVDGGLRVTGTWSWGSGTQHSNWIGGGCLLVDADGKPCARDDGLRAPFVFFAAEDVSFTDTWHVSGLEGTGSGDYSVTDVFVPEGRWVQMGIDTPRIGGAASRLSFYGLLASGVASCAVGIARRSIDELVALAGAKSPQGSKRTLAERPRVQADVAMAEAKLGSAWAFMREAVAESSVGDEASDRQTSVEHKRLLRLAAAHATQTAAEVTDMMYKAGGGAAVYRTSPLQRAFRDCAVATQHAMVAPRMFDTVGRIRLGLETDTRTL